LVVAGGFAVKEMRARVTRLFSGLPASGEDPTVRTVEPPPNAARRATLVGPGTTPYVEVGWRAPAITDPATPAAILLDLLLGGESRMFAVGGTWGRAREHPASRLYTALVDPGLAVRAVSEFRPRVHPGQFTVQVQTARGIRAERVEAALDAEIARLTRRGPSSTELAEARVKLRRASTLAYEGATRIGFRLGYFAMLGERSLESDLLRSVLKITRSEARDAAVSLFRTEARTTVWYEPTEAAHGE
ncbi:MAG: insulinase family protein, partial [Thermoplasmata archaeon]|nr:insulinase family protein [Thermoplasmata archaeon]